jgi:tetratricopeptide (TPR) repeat protein
VQEDRRSARRYFLAVSDAQEDWERRTAALWASFDDYGEAQFVAAVGVLVAELPPQSAIGFFERACAFDSTGQSDLAVPLYDAALKKGLTGERRRRAVIQLSSSLRNIGQPQAAVDLLTAELRLESDALTGAVRATLALALADVGREREAVSVALTALAEYLPRYNRSMAAYARELIADKP